jgi:hypothetical protein
MTGGIAAVLMVALLAGPADARATFKPDAMTLGRTGTATIGNNVYNTTGANQTRTRSAPAGSNLVFRFRMQNDSDAVQFLTPKGCASTANFTVKYFLLQPPAAPIDVTSSITSGALAVGRNPGQTETFRVEVKIRAGAPRGATLRCRLQVSINRKGPDDPTDVTRLIIHRS